MRPISRRDFLKLISLSPAVLGASSFVRPFKAQAQTRPHNVIVLVFDTWSARHMALYGYPRQTMPNLEQFARRCTVYHRHYSTGTFTVPGTASLLTGLHPWSHRALALSGEISQQHRDHQIFRLLAGSHSTLAFTQNEFADILLAEAGPALERRVPIGSFSLRENLVYSQGLFRNDAEGAHASLEYDIFQRDTGADASLFAGPLKKLLQWRGARGLNQEYLMSYPHGLPASPDLFRLEDVIDGVMVLLRSLQEPSLAYLHLYPPHGDYRPKGKFNHMFEDGWTAPRKAVHPLVRDVKDFDRQDSQRNRYDQYLASWDAELGRLFGYMASSGLLDRSHVIITSDHGELFERGVVGHSTPLIYEPIVHVPLLISRPGQTDQVDVHTTTSSVDLLPTIAGLAGVAIPPWAEGEPLPEFGGTPDDNRAIYSLDAKTNSAFAPLERLSISMLKNDYRLTYYDYPDQNYQGYELYNLGQDPDELNDLYSEGSSPANSLRDEMLGKLAAVNRHYAR